MGESPRLQPTPSGPGWAAPDVYKTYQPETGGELVNLDEREGWIELLNLAEGKPDSAIVINTGARNQTGISNFGKTLSKALPQLKRKLVVFWLIDRKRESLELLSDFLEAIPDAEMHVVRNMYVGPEKKFELYNVSKMRTAIEKNGGRSLNFPEVADRVTAKHGGRGRIEARESGRNVGYRRVTRDNNGSCRHCPLRNKDGQFVGVLTKGDLVNPEPLQRIGKEATVGDLMTPDVIAVYEDDPALAAVHELATRKVHRLIVLNSENELAGIVSTMDVVRAVDRGLSFLDR